MEKIVLGLSGGVDSAVAALLLQREGYTVSGLYLDIGTENSRKDAISVAEFLGIPLTVLDVSAELQSKVCLPFIESYLRGKTPNPCILCNPSVKFSALEQEADRVGAKFIATGHYAQVVEGTLYKGSAANDQSYMLHRLRKSQLARLVLPLGKMEKREVRSFAQSFEIPVADKPDSMEICFIPDRNYSTWLACHTTLPGPGYFVRDGEIIGRHEGIHCWTVGQRIQGIYDNGTTKLYVKAIHPETREIEVCPDIELYRKNFITHDFHWLIDFPEQRMRGTIKVRHSKTGSANCEAILMKGGKVQICCDDPVRAPAPGQSAVLYNNNQVLGGGFIE